MDDAILGVNTWIHRQRFLKRLGVVFFGDQESAFPLASQAAIRHLLDRAAFPAGVVRRIMWLVGRTKHWIKWRGGIHPGPTQEDGISQGGGLSPTLLLLLEWLLLFFEWLLLFFSLFVCSL